MSESTAPPTIAIIAPGAMGAAVAGRLTSAGCTVLTTFEGRSPTTVERAKAAGMEDASLTDIVRRAAWVLSILPPSRALDFAKTFREAYGDSAHALVFVDCNAVSPETKKLIGRVFDGSAVRFVDSSIIGLPPKDGYDPAFYASAKPSDADVLDGFVGLNKWGLRVIPLRGENTGVGDASALKMSYSGINKGVIGLMTTMILAAHASSPATAEALLSELHASQPDFLRYITQHIPLMLPKAYRFVGEMEETSSYVRDCLGDFDGIHHTFADLFKRIEGQLPAGDDIAVLKKFEEDAKAIIGQQGGK